MESLIFEMEYNKNKKEIILDKELNNLDKFAFDFFNIAVKYVDCVIISGYVSILLGRSRITEDVDIFIKKIPKETFELFYNDLVSNGFWCINSDNSETLFDYLKDGLAIRFAHGKIPMPNMEVKFPKDKLDEDAFEDAIAVKLPEREIKISSLERHIAFKKYFLGSEKDDEDALHIEELFKKDIDYGKIKKLQKLIKLRKNEI